MSYEPTEEDVFRWIKSTWITVDEDIDLVKLRRRNAW